MTFFLTASTDEDILNVLFILNDILFFILILLALMLLTDTAYSVEVGFATAPPHNIAPFTLMRPARPVVILFFPVLLSTEFTDFLINIHVSPLFQLDDPCSHFCHFNHSGVILLLKDFKGKRFCLKL
jgi:hypothetical protein